MTPTEAPTETESDTRAIRVQTAGHICTITLNRPDVLNAFNNQLTADLAEALKNAQRDADIRVVVITGEGRAFSSGQDLGDLKKKYVPGYVPSLGEDLRSRYNPLISRIREMNKPVIAAVNGVAAGAGCSLALACDMRIASEHASFIEVFINVGLIPDSGSTFTLPRLVGMGKAFELCTLGSKIDAQEALRLGLVNQVVGADELIETTRKVAGRLASLPGKAIELTKRLLNASLNNDLAAQLDMEAYMQETAGRTEDHIEGVMAFLEKRAPAFKGK